MLVFVDSADEIKHAFNDRSVANMGNTENLVTCSSNRGDMIASISNLRKNGKSPFSDVDSNSVSISTGMAQHRDNDDPIFSRVLSRANSYKDV